MQSNAKQSEAMQSKAMQSKAMQSKAMQSDAKHSKAAQSKAMQSKAMQSKAKQCKAMQSNAKQCRAMQSNAKRSNAKQSKAKQCKAKRSNAKQSNAKQCKASKAKQTKAKQCKTRQSRAKKYKTRNAFNNVLNIFLKRKMISNWGRAGFIFFARALSGHVSNGHKVLHPIQKYVGSASVCQRCLLCFTARSRLIHHLRQGSLQCSLFYSTHLPELSYDEGVASMKASTNFKCSLGHNRLTATVPVHRAHGPIWDPPVPPLAPPLAPP